MKKVEIKKLIKSKKVIVIATVVAVLGGGIVVVKNKQNNTLQTANMNEVEETVILKKGDINKSIIVTGNVKSGEVSNVSASINAKVKSINVKVGDMVEAGDIICVLDDSDILKEIENKNKEIEEQRKTLKDNYDKLVNQLNSLKNTQNENLTALNRAVDEANKNLNNTNADLNNYASTFNSIKNTYNIMMSGIKNALDNYNNALNYKTQCYETWIKSGGKTDTQEYKKYVEANENLSNKEADLNKAKELYDYDNIDLQYTEALKIYEEKVLARDSAKSQYDEAVSSRTSTINSNNSEISELQANINDANNQIEKLNNNEELKAIKEKLDKTVLKAETSGKVTNLKVNVGSMAEGDIATIQSTDKLILQVSIPEYDIQNVTTGLKAKITSDTLKDKVDGELIGISPVAGDGDKKGFSAEIAIANGQGLFIGTTAKAEIIISSKENIILAPIDAIKDIDSNPSVLLKLEDGKVSEVPVTIGEKNDYYVEISGDKIKEGVKIIANVESYNTNNSNMSE